MILALRFIFETYSFLVLTRQEDSNCLKFGIVDAKSSTVKYELIQLVLNKINFYWLLEDQRKL